MLEIGQKINSNGRSNKMTKRKHIGMMLASLMPLGLLDPQIGQKKAMVENDEPNDDSQGDKLRIEKAKVKRERKALKRLSDKNARDR